MSNDQRVVGVVGSGVMGAGIAQLFAQAGCQIRLHDSNADALARGLAGIKSLFDRLVEKEKLTAAEAETVLGRIHPAAELSDLVGSDLVIEAIVEKLEPKQQLFRALSDLLPVETLLATNTSSLSVAEIGRGLAQPERFLGLHFFNPVPLMKLVEIIPTAHTSAAVIAAAEALVKASGHRAVKAKDSPGFIVNLFGRAYVTEGLAILEEGVCDAATLDVVLRRSLGLRMGPGELLDLTGLDVTVPVMESIYAGFYSDPRLRPAALGRYRLLNGLLGRKSGEGFYRYADGKRMEAPLETRVGDDTTLPSIHIVEAARRPNVLAWAAATGAALVSQADADLIVVAPLGSDVTEEIALQRLDGSRTVGIDPIFATAEFAALTMTPATSELARAAARRVLAAVPGAITNDSVGLVAQRVMAVMVNLAAEMAQKAIGSATDIDVAVTLALGYPRGPFAWADLIGLDTVLEITQRIFAVTGDPRYRPSPWLRRRAQLGMSLGQQ